MWKKPHNWYRFVVGAWKHPDDMPPAPDGETWRQTFTLVYDAYVWHDRIAPVKPWLVRLGRVGHKLVVRWLWLEFYEDIREDIREALRQVREHLRSRK